MYRRILALAILATVLCLGADKKPPTAEEKEAYRLTKSWITQTLKAPATARFQPIEEVEFSPHENGIMNVRIYVDAQNTYAAMIRTRFICEVGPISPERLYRVKCTNVSAK